MTRQTEEPKGSAMMPPSPLLENSTETESTLSPPLERKQLFERALDVPDAIVRERAVQKARQLRQHRRPARRLVAKRAQQPLQADLLAHPVLEERLGGGPQVEVRVELAPEPL